jgi:predicted anti-sigma-YlaC factor YlaD
MSGLQGDRKSCYHMLYGMLSSLGEGWCAMTAAEKMSCREFVELIGTYRDGDLPKSQHSAFAVHMSECPKCRAYLNSYEATLRLARAAIKPSEQEDTNRIPEDLVKSILARKK